MKQILHGATDLDGINASTVVYHTLDGVHADSTTEANRAILVPEASTLRYLRVVGPAPGSGKSVEYTVMVNGVASALTCTMSDAATMAEDTTHSVSIAEGDLVSLRSTPTGTPTVGKTYWASELDITAATRAVWCGGMLGGTLHTSDGGYFVPLGGGGTGRSFPAADISVMWNIDATLRKLVSKLSVAPGVGKSHTMNVNKNDSNTGTGCQVSGTNTSAVQAYAGGAGIDMAPGDIFAVNPVPAGGPAAAILYYGISYEPDIDNQWCDAGFGGVPATSTVYNGVPDSNGWDGTESRMYTGSRAATGSMDYKAKSLRVALYDVDSITPSAPTAGKSRTVTLRVDAADTGLSASVADANTNATDTEDVSIGSGTTRLSMMQTSSGSPASKDLRWALLFEGTPPAASVSGQLATASASALTATIAMVRTAEVAGAVAPVAAAALDGTVLIGGIEVAGQPAQANAAALAATVSTAQQPSVSGAVAGAVADAIAAAILHVLSVDGEVAQATASALAAGILTSNPTVSGAVAEALAAALAADIDTITSPIVVGEPATALAHVRPADVVTTFIEPPIGSGGGGSVGGGSGTVGSGGSPAGFNWGACAIDFAIDLFVLGAQPFAIRRVGPKHEIRTSPRGYALPSLREGREWEFQWGEALVDTATVDELRERVGTALRHGFTWTEPDGTPMDIIGSIKEIEWEWSQASPGFYKSVIFHVLEHER